MVVTKQVPEKATKPSTNRNQAYFAVYCCSRRRIVVVVFVHQVSEKVEEAFDKPEEDVFLYRVGSPIHLM